MAGSASAEELLTDSLSELRWPRVSLPCKGAKRLPMNFRISASRALQTTATPPASWPAIGMHADVLGQAHTTSMCARCSTLGHGSLGVHVQGIRSAASRDWGADIGHWKRRRAMRSDFTERSLSKCARRGAANSRGARLGRHFQRTILWEESAALARSSVPCGGLSWNAGTAVLRGSRLARALRLGGLCK